MSRKTDHSGVNRDYAALQDQTPYHIDIDKIPPLDIGLQARHPIVTHDKIMSVLTGEPGDYINWHTHASTNHQMIVVIEGEVRWTYRDNNGDEDHVDVSAGEAIYLPGSLENKVEVIGDKPSKQIDVLPNLFHQRLENNLGVKGDPSSGGGYGYDKEDDMIPTFGLWHDYVRDEVVYKHDEAVINR